MDLTIAMESTQTEGVTAQIRPRGLRHNPWITAHLHRIDRSMRILVVAALILLLARHLRIDVGPLPALVALLPWVAVLCAAVAMTSWRLRLVVPGVSAIVITAVIAFQWVPAFTVNRDHQAESGSDHVRVMAFNSAANPVAFAAAASAAKQLDVDVLLVVEAVPAIHDQLPYQALETAFSYRYLEVADQVGIWSRRPLANVESLPMFSGGKSTTLDIGGTDVTVIAAHTQSPRYTRAWPWRRDQHQLRDIVDDQPAGPLILAGDLNMTRDHGWFRDYLSSGFVDAGDVAGKGWKGTWSYGIDNWPLVTIDHFLARGVSIANYDTVRIHGSDHLAIVADFSLAGR